MGYRVYYFPLTKIIHFVGKSADFNYKVAISNQLLSKIKFFKKNHPFSKYFIIFYLIFLISLVKTILFAIIAIFSEKNKKKFYAYLYTLQLIANHKF